MKVLFNGLGPKDTITYEGKLYRNGSAVELPKEVAAAYLETHLAIPIETVEDEKEVEALQKLEAKNAAKRKTIQEKAKEAEVN